MRVHEVLQEIRGLCRAMTRGCGRVVMVLGPGVRQASAAAFCPSDSREIVCTHRASVFSSVNGAIKGISFDVVVRIYLVIPCARHFAGKTMIRE